MKFAKLQRPDEKDIWINRSHVVSAVGTEDPEQTRLNLVNGMQIVRGELTDVIAVLEGD